MLIPTFEVSSEREVKRALKKLGPKIGKKPIRKGARAGAQVMAAELKKRTPKGRTGNLKRQVKVRAGKRKRDRILLLAITGDGGDGYYSRMVNYGRKAGGWHKGRVKGQLYQEAAYKASKDDANRVAAETIAKETNELLRG